jgi:ribulose-phosphate 3-epimerase
MSLMASVSLWSADMTRFAEEIARVDPYADSYHLDVCDGRYAANLLFFPDLVASLRPLTTKPFEVHLITYNPEMWIPPFSEAGANSFIFYPDATPEVDGLITRIKSLHLGVGLSLSLEQPVSMIEEFLPQLDVVTIIGTESGIKGVQTVAPAAIEKIRELAQLRASRGYRYQIQADGAIRWETVPLLVEAGADGIVPGSLFFKEDIGKVSKWVHQAFPKAHGTI